MRQAYCRVGWMWRPAAVVVAALLLAHFVDFAVGATRPPVTSHGKADGIVVLTGGAARLGEAGRLMREGFARRLLVSGANSKVRREDIERLTGIEGAAFRCCVDVGYVAQDTIGNAAETRAWATAHAFRRLIVVTASYHMPRSLAEFAHAMPSVELSAHPVVPRDLATSSWWCSADSMRILASEYFKYMSASLRLAVARLIGNDAPMITTHKNTSNAMTNQQ